MDEFVAFRGLLPLAQAGIAGEDELADFFHKKERKPTTSARDLHVYSLVERGGLEFAVQ